MTACVRADGRTGGREGGRACGLGIGCDLGLLFRELNRGKEFNLRPSANMRKSVMRDLYDSEHDAKSIGIKCDEKIMVWNTSTSKPPPPGDQCTKPARSPGHSATAVLVSPSMPIRAFSYLTSGSMGPVHIPCGLLGAYSSKGPTQHGTQ